MLAPFSLTPALDASGRLIRTAAMMVYQAGTTTPAVLYRQADYAAGTEHANPIRANGAGLIPAMYGRGAFKFRLLTAPPPLGVILWEADGVTLTDPVAFDLGAGGSSTALLQTGMFAQFYGTGTRPGFVRANQRTIGNAASGATERAAADTLPLYLMLYAEDDSLVVVGGRGQTAQADFDAGKALTLPDARCRALTTLDGMGGGAVGGLNSVAWNAGGSAARLGSYGGAATAALSVGNMPSHNHPFAVAAQGSGAFTFNGTTGADNQDHIHSTPIYSIGLQGGPANLFLPAVGGTTPTAAISTSGKSQSHGHPYTVSVGDHNHALSYNMDLVGGGQAFSVVQPLLMVTTYLKL